MSITLPPILEDINKAFDMINVVKNIMSLDSKSMKAIEDNIKNYHKLNDAERNKSEEARNLILQYQELLKSTNIASAKLVIDKELIIKEKKEFEVTRQSQLDDIAVKNHTLNENKDSFEKQCSSFDTIKKQVSVAQATVDAATQRNLDKEQILSKKEQALELKEKELNGREIKIRNAEDEVGKKISKLKQIIE